MAAALPVSPQSTSHCLDSRENLTDVACYRTLRPVGQIHPYQKLHFLRPNLPLEALEYFADGSKGHKLKI